MYNIFEGDLAELYVQFDIRCNIAKQAKMTQVYEPGGDGYLV